MNGLAEYCHVASTVTTWFVAIILFVSIIATDDMGAGARFSMLCLFGVLAPVLLHSIMEMLA